MNYYDALDEIVTRSQAVAEVRAHQVSVDEFFEEVGFKDEYTGKEVLCWLGY